MRKRALDRIKDNEPASSNDETTRMAPPFLPNKSPHSCSESDSRAFFALQTWPSVLLPVKMRWFRGTR